MTPASDTGIREVIVIGSGLDRYTAALYTARAEFEPLVFGGAIFVGRRARGPVGARARL